MIMGNVLSSYYRLIVMSFCLTGMRTEECHTQTAITLYAPWTLTSQGSTVFLPCRVKGEPQPYVTWLDNEDNRIPKSLFARRAVMPNGDLRIKNLKWADMGQYTCRAHLNSAEVIHKSVTSFLYPVENQIQTTYVLSVNRPILVRILLDTHDT